MTFRFKVLSLPLQPICVSFGKSEWQVSAKRLLRIQLCFTFWKVVRTSRQGIMGDKTIASGFGWTSTKQWLVDSLSWLGFVSDNVPVYTTGVSGPHASLSPWVVGFITQLVLRRLARLDSIINELLMLVVKYVDHQINLQTLTASCTQRAVGYTLNYTLFYNKGGFPSMVFVGFCFWGCCSGGYSLPLPCSNSSNRGCPLKAGIPTLPRGVCINHCFRQTESQSPKDSVLSSFVSRFSWQI